MLKTTLMTAALLTATAGLAHAGGQAGTIGVGAEFLLTGIGNAGLGGASVNYDAGQFHVGGFFGFFDPQGANNTTWDIGARFYYHLHSTAMSDFGVGGRIGLLSEHDNPPNQNDTLTELFIEPGVQMRVFLAANVAVSASAGIIIGTVDASGVAITGQTIGGGLTYYFF